MSHSSTVQSYTCDLLNGCVPSTRNGIYPLPHGCHFNCDAPYRLTLPPHLPPQYEPHIVSVLPLGLHVAREVPHNQAPMVRAGIHHHHHHHHHHQPTNPLMKKIPFPKGFNPDTVVDPKGYPYCSDRAYVNGLAAACGTAEQGNLPPPGYTPICADPHPESVPPSATGKPSYRFCYAEPKEGSGLKGFYYGFNLNSQGQPVLTKIVPDPIRSFTNMF